MKEKKQTIRVIMCLIIFTVLVIYLINHGSIVGSFFSALLSLLFPFLLGCGIAFIINIPMRNIEQKLFKNEQGKLYRARRLISMVITYLLALIVVGLVIFVVVPEVADTISSVKDKMPDFVENVKAWALKYTEKYPEITKRIMDIEPQWDELGNIFKDNGSTILTTVVSMFSSIISAVVNTLIGIVFSFYILAQKEKLEKQLKMVCYALFKESVADELMVFGRIANTTFSKFFSCQFREGIILGAMFLVAMTILRFPYALTIGVLIAFTALIPVFGAFFGLFIGAFLILVESPKYVLGFIILFFVLQFIENYFIYPRLVGGDIGLSAIWVLLAVTVGGDLMGVVGMLIFIPLASVLYAYSRSIIYRRLKKKNINVDEKHVPDNAIPLFESRHRLFQPRKQYKAEQMQGNQKTENAEAESVKTENVDTENVEIENVGTENAEAENVKTENVDTEKTRSGKK